MAIIKCPYCAEDIQEEAKICKHCKKTISLMDKANIKLKISEENRKKAKEEKIKKENIEKLKKSEKLNDKINKYPEKYRDKVKNDLKFLNKLENMSDEDIKNDILKREKKLKVYLLWIFTFLFMWSIPYILPISIWLHPNKKEKDLFINRFKDYKKYYIRIILTFFALILAFGIAGTNEAAKKAEQIRIQQEQKENSTKMNVSYDIKENYTIKDKIKITINTNNIKKLILNNEEIDLQNKNNIERIFNLKLGDNLINIIGKNGDIIRKSNKNIKRLTKEEYKEKLKQIEEEKKEKERIAEIERKRQEGLKRAEKIKKQFSAWDGSHMYLKRFVVENLKDPDSFEHISTNYEILNDKKNGYYIYVIMKYRAKNSFGGYVIGFYGAYFDIDGNPIKTSDWKSE